jgi:hypothetical protein
VTEPLVVLLNDLARTTPLVSVLMTRDPLPGNPDGCLEDAVASLYGGGRFTGLRWWGLPDGLEFGVFLESLVLVSHNAPSALPSEVRGVVDGLGTALELSVFVAPT